MSRIIVTLGHLSVRRLFLALRVRGWLVGSSTSGLGNTVRRLFSRYLVVIGVLANALAATFVLYWASDKVVGSELYREGRRLVSGSLDGVEVTQVAAVAAGNTNPGLKRLPAGTWIKIHEQASGSEDAFVRQTHGGAAFDPVRGRVMLFGSDTHSRDWDNSVRFFDMGTLSWSRAYAEDDPDTYRVNAEGFPVAGKGVERPWAMHTFDAVEFDPAADRLIVASHPKHMTPKKKWGVDKALWKSIRSHPTWFYYVAENRWEPKRGKAVSFFPNGGAFDPNRRAFIGVNAVGFWELPADSTKWRRLGKGSARAWHNSAAYDHDRDVVVSFGTNKRSNAIWQYRRGEKKGRKMPTPGLRPPGAESPPLVYHPGIQRVVALVKRRKKNTPGSTETWLYSTRDDAWSRLETATLPFDIGMNYDMVYDPRHDLLVLVANMRHEPTAVWVLRL